MRILFYQEVQLNFLDLRSAYKKNYKKLLKTDWNNTSKNQEINQKKLMFRFKATLLNYILFGKEAVFWQLSNLFQPEFQKFYHTKQEYDEQGPRVARHNAISSFL